MRDGSSVHRGLRVGGLIGNRAGNPDRGKSDDDPQPAAGVRDTPVNSAQVSHLQAVVRRVAMPASFGALAGDGASDQPSAEDGTHHVPDVNMFQQPVMTARGQALAAQEHVQVAQDPGFDPPDFGD